MEPLRRPRQAFLVALLLAALGMASCAVPGAPYEPPSQPPITVVVVVTAVQPADVTPTATATPKAIVVEPTATPTGKAVVERTATPTSKAVVIEPTATSTGKPPTARPTFTPTVFPDTPRPSATSTRPPPPTQTRTAAPTATRTRTAAPTATRTRTATPTPEPTTRELFSTYRLNAGKAPSVFGDKGDVVVYPGERMPPGCEVFKVLGREYSRFGAPMSASAESINDGMHGWSVTKENADPRDYGVKIHWWYNAGSFVSVRIHYIVRQPWNVDCLVPGKMQTTP